MKIYDISMPIIKEMPVYKNKEEKRPLIETVQSDYVTESKIHLDVHTGTHVDANLHMIPKGSTTESIHLEQLVRKCKVFDFTHVTDGITKADLESKHIEKHDFILFKTKNSSDHEFNFDFIYLKEDGAQYLVEKEVVGVGIDALGVERSQPGHPTHKTLMGNDIIIIEGLRLSEVSEGDYLLVAAPLKLVGIDAAPARVMLLKDVPNI